MSQEISHHGPADASESAYSNECICLLLERSSCRSFTDRAIPEEVLRTALEAGNRAATAGNLQPYSIIKICDREKREKLAELCGQGFIAQAPVLLLFCIDWHRLKRWATLEVAPFAADRSFRHFWVSFQDTVICAQSICSAADAVGLGSVYIGTILDRLGDVHEMFGLPDAVFPVVLLCLGYPKTRPPRRRKLGIEALVHSERYQEMSDQELLGTYARKHGRGVAITEERLETISRVCTRVQGSELARDCLAKIEESGVIGPVQRYFGLHYRADGMAEGNADFLRLVQEFGFGWFSDYVPSGEPLGDE